MRNLDSSEINNFEYLSENQLAQPIKLHESWAGRRLMEALSHLPELSGSLDMRFQQRQQQEKEQRRIELSGSGSGGTTNETDVARNSLTTAKTSNIGNGKVRQMFDERRRGAGIDRSNPLKPIKPISSSKAISTPTLAAPQQSKTTNKVYGVRSQDQIASKTNSVAARKPVDGPIKHQTSSRSSRSQKISEQNNNLSNDDLDGDNLSKGFGDSITNDSNNNRNSYNNKKDVYNGNGATTPTIKLNPVLTKKSPPARTASRQASGTAGHTPSITTKRQQNETTLSMKSESLSSARSSKAANSVRSTPISARSKVDSAGSPSFGGEPPAGMVPCRICGRNFNEDRIEKHEKVCEKMANTKRKVFDAAKHRIQGTEAEQYNRKKPNSRSSQRSTTYTSAAAASGQKIAPKKSNWRLKHEEFITAIRAAKQVQAHLARGGKLSDLPPPPPSENPDYIQCPHCQRRFNQTAAERHIPKCATMMHNKPKPGVAIQPKRR